MSVQKNTDYAMHPHAKEKMAPHLRRHRSNENCNECMTASTVSRHIRWEAEYMNSPSMHTEKQFRTGSGFVG